MLLWAKYATPTAKVYHAVDQKYPRQKHYVTLCGQHRKRWEIGGAPLGRKCKTCKRMISYHQKRPPPM